MSAVDVDLELARWVLDYIRENGEASEAGVVREFFPGEPDTAHTYLDFLKRGQAICRQGQSWFPVLDGNSAPSKAAAVSAPKRVSIHKDCTHARTRYERQKCRMGYYEPGTLERAPSVTQIIRAMKPKPAPKPKRIPKPAPEPKPQLTPEEAWAKRKQWNGRRLTVPWLSHLIYKRMRANRDRQYVFTREWLYRQYPGVDREMVDSALQRLVEAGRISALPK